MKKVQVAREVADALHVAEASLEATIVESKKALERMLAAKAELGLTGTVGDSSVARVAEAVAALEQAKASIYEGHRDAYAIMKMLDIRAVAGTVIPIGLQRDEDTRAA